jgi:hypothetical protein
MVRESVQFWNLFFERLRIVDAKLTQLGFDGYFVVQAPEPPAVSCGMLGHHERAGRM